MAKVFRPNVKPNQFYPIDESVYTYGMEDITTSEVQRFFLNRRDGGEDDIIEFPYAGYWDRDVLNNKFGITLVDTYPNGLAVLEEGYTPEHMIDLKGDIDALFAMPIDQARKIVYQLRDSGIEDADEMFTLLKMYFKHLKGVDI